MPIANLCIYFCMGTFFNGKPLEMGNAAVVGLDVSEQAKLGLGKLGR